MVFPGAGARNTQGDAVSVVSSLGDDQVHGNSDKDTFEFKASEGDQVTIRLGDDPSAGHIGSQATLRLKSGRGMGRFEKEARGVIPLAITTTIPESGVYDVIVLNSDVLDNLLQSDVPDNLLAFKGGYVLSVVSTGDKIESLVPAGNFEN